jgi:uncharacterized membrane protein
MTDPLVELSKIAATFGVAFFSLWGAVPAGLALGLNVITVVLTAAASYAVGVGVVLFLGEKVRGWFMRRFGDKIPTDPNSRVRRLLDRYGAAGLGMIAPVTLGAQLGAVVGVAMGLSTRRLFVWLMIGGFVWAIIFGVVFALGIAGVQSVTSG